MCSNYSFIHSFIYSFIHSINQSINHSINQSIIESINVINLNAMMVFYAPSRRLQNPRLQISHGFTFKASAIEFSSHRMTDSFTLPLQFLRGTGRQKLRDDQTAWLTPGQAWEPTQMKLQNRKSQIEPPDPNVIDGETWCDFSLRLWSWHWWGAGLALAILLPRVAVISHGLLLPLPLNEIYDTTWCWNSNNCEIQGWNWQRYLTFWFRLPKSGDIWW